MEISARKSPETPPMFSHSSLYSVFLTFEVMKAWMDLLGYVCLIICYIVSGATEGPNSLIQELGSVKNINLAIKEERYKDAEPSYYVSPPLPQFCRKQQQQPTALLAQERPMVNELPSFPGCLRCGWKSYRLQCNKVVILDADMIICGPIVPWKLSAEKASLLQRIWVKLSKYIGDKHVILFFYALDFTFVCHRSPLSTTATLSLRSSTQKSWVFQLKVWLVALLLNIFYNTKMCWNFASIEKSKHAMMQNNKKLSHYVMPIRN
ncbi:hypothetical protein DVH24_015772 [Malus domestica]|uniref:Uncharacterized protein n=1 Tax=Malus domestica TaxID=3750 RepID=A0A498HKA6_MALDO|nr:hypothetical protein DVH24_015772 [Malus domestica]